MPTYSGTVYDATSETPLPWATVQISIPGMPAMAEAADSFGEFSIATREAANKITISHSGYKTYAWPAYEQIHRYELERNERELPPVVITSHKKNKWFVWAALLGLIFLMKKK